MALRVIPSEVKEIITTELTDLDAFIAAANTIVEDNLVGKGLSTARLKEIERWLAAHFTAMKEDSARVVEEEVRESRNRYGENTRGVLGEGLKLTRYGQQAMVLDTTGALIALNSTPARFTVI